MKKYRKTGAKKNYRKTGLKRVEKKQVAKIVKRALNNDAETKYVNSPPTFLTIGQDSTYLNDFTNIPKGDDDNNERQGDEVYFKYLKINLELIKSVGAFDTPARSHDRVRVIILKWLVEDFVHGMPNLPTLNDLFEDNHYPINNFTNLAMISPKESGRKFKILYDRKIDLFGDLTSVPGAPAPDSPERGVKRLSFTISSKKYGNQKIKYDSSATLDNIHKNGLFMMILTDAGQTVTTPTGTTVFAPIFASIQSRLAFRE